MNLNLHTYKEINEDFKPVLGYHLGRRSGFFAEHINMLQAMLFCLQNNIQFQLYSKDANFAIKDGWTDYFEPFCPVQLTVLHRFLNPRFPTQKFRFKLRKAMAPIVKGVSGSDYLTYEIWQQINENSFNNKQIQIPSLDYNGPAIEAFRAINQMVWSFNSPTKSKIAEINKTTDLPREYATIHIRSGDKHKEAQIFSPSIYIEKLKELTNISDVLVLTDDYRNFTLLLNNYPEMNFYTLESDKQLGYRHRANKRRPVDAKHNDYLRFLVGTECARSSQLYLGTLSSNVSRYLQLWLDKSKCHSLD